jgi:NAD(P)-dependent dehydrogenase (short-subunit alcohol dehydrogenase family)
MRENEIRIVVVTGGATGIGAATVAAFASSGHQVYSLDIDASGGQTVADRNPGTRFVHTDITSDGDVAAAMARIDEEAGRIDVLVNNAGGFGEAKGIEQTELEEWRHLIEINLTSMFLVSKAALPLLRRSSAARIVNIGSLSGQTAGWQTSPAYVAAKGGVHAFTRALASERAAEGITVNALAPSAVLTDRIRSLRDEAALEATARSIPLGRYQEPEEVAEWIVFLGSPAAGFATGQTISVNGGRFMA